MTKDDTVEITVHFSQDTFAKLPTDEADRDAFINRAVDEKVSSDKRRRDAGFIKTEKKAQSSRENGKKGGRKFLRPQYIVLIKDDGNGGLFEIQPSEYPAFVESYKGKGWGIKKITAERAMRLEKVYIMQRLGNSDAGEFPIPFQEVVKIPGKILVAD